MQFTTLIATLCLISLTNSLPATNPPLDTSPGSILGSVYDNFPSFVDLSTITQGGSGCPTGTSIDTDVSPNGRVISIQFPETFSASFATSRRQFCQATIQLEHDVGWQFMVKEVITRGHVKLDDETYAASVENLIYFPGGTDQGTTTKRFEPMFGQKTDRDFRIRSDVKNEVWSECGTAEDGEETALTTVNIKSSLGVSMVGNGPTGKNMVAEVSGNGETQSYYLLWKTCVPSATS